MCRNPTLLISMRTKFLQLLFSPTIRSLKRDLGMLFDKHMNLHHAASHALRPCNAAIPTSSHVFKVSIFQLRRSPFFTWFVLRFISFS
jgi:hypothetical protein